MSHFILVSFFLLSFLTLTIGDADGVEGECPCLSLRECPLENPDDNPDIEECEEDLVRCCGVNVRILQSISQSDASHFIDGDDDLTPSESRLSSSSSSSRNITKVTLKSTTEVPPLISKLPPLTPKIRPFKRNRMSAAASNVIMRIVKRPNNEEGELVDHQQPPEVGNTRRRLSLTSLKKHEKKKAEEPEEPTVKKPNRLVVLRQRRPMVSMTTTTTEKPSTPKTTLMSPSYSQIKWNNDNDQNLIKEKSPDQKFTFNFDFKISKKNDSSMTDPPPISNKSDVLIPISGSYGDDHSPSFQDFKDFDDLSDNGSEWVPMEMGESRVRNRVRANKPEVIKTEFQFPPFRRIQSSTERYYGNDYQGERVVAMTTTPIPQVYQDVYEVPNNPTNDDQPTTEVVTMTTTPLVVTTPPPPPSRSRHSSYTPNHATTGGYHHGNRRKEEQKPNNRFNIGTLFSSGTTTTTDRYSPYRYVPTTTRRPQMIQRNPTHRPQQQQQQSLPQIRFPTNDDQGVQQPTLSHQTQPQTIIDDIVNQPERDHQWDGQRYEEQVPVIQQHYELPIQQHEQINRQNNYAQNQVKNVNNQQHQPIIQEVEPLQPTKLLIQDGQLIQDSRFDEGQLNNNDNNNEGQLSLYHHGNSGLQHSQINNQQLLKQNEFVTQQVHPILTPNEIITQQHVNHHGNNQQLHSQIIHNQQNQLSSLDSKKASLQQWNAEEDNNHRAPPPIVLKSPKVGVVLGQRDQVVNQVVHPHGNNGERFQQENVPQQGPVNVNFGNQQNHQRTHGNNQQNPKRRGQQPQRIINHQTRLNINNQQFHDNNQQRPHLIIPMEPVINHNQQSRFNHMGLTNLRKEEEKINNRFQFMNDVSRHGNREARQVDVEYGGFKPIAVWSEEGPEVVD